MMVKIANVSVLLFAAVGFAGIVSAEPKETPEPVERAMPAATMAPAAARHSRRVMKSDSAQGVYGEPVLLDAQDYVDEQESTNTPMEPRAPEDTIK